MAGPAASRKMVTRAWWLGMASDEESRAYLQQRLTLLSKLMFWSFAALLVMMFLLYARYPTIAPEGNDTIYTISLVGMVVLVAIWRGLLVRRPLSMRGLYAVDLFYGVAYGSTFAAAVCLAAELKMGMTANILWASFMIFLRAIVVPSTYARTAIVGALSYLPMVVAAAILPFISEQEFPPPALIGSAVVVGVVVVLLATIGSDIIYGLRMQVSAAMRLGQYTLDAKIAEGGNGSVYRAHHALLRRPTAIKLIRPDRIEPETLDRFEREVQHTSQLTHPNTVAIYDFGRSPDGLFYYAMEYLDGIDLEQLVQRHGPQPDDRVVAILVQVCGALAEAHHRNLIHRDIKPGNIILCERGEVPDVAKVVDFGLAKEITAEQGKTQRLIGTPAYIAPELVTDPGRVTPAVDLYALGAVGYYLLTGKRVFEGNTVVEVCFKHVTLDPVRPSELVPGISPELEQLLLRCLAKDPAARPESARALAALLRAVPPRGNWSEADAERWWREHARSTPSSTTQTLTVTIDLEARDGDAGTPPATRGRGERRTLAPASDRASA